MKKLLNVFMIVCMLILSVSPINAARLHERNLSKEEFLKEKNLDYNEILEISGSKTFNEFDAIANLDKYEEKRSYDNNKYEFKKKLSELAKENQEDLIKLGINKERAKYIKTLENISPEKITDEQAKRASANMSFSLDKNWNHGEKASFICNWAWDSAPLTASDDILAFAWTTGYIIDLNETTMRVEYKDIYGNYEGSRRFSPEGRINGCGFIFPQSYRSPGIRGISSGKAFVVVENRENKNYLEVASEYGHTYIGVTPGFSINGMSISFNRGISKEAYDYIQWR